ncbi:hypothetical protein LMG27952_03149 [Paraburkholderia hiiakae]|uniref:Peptidase S74 domain-containing protein n=1 Tax=Paraburkholderia hiiakae TaxID=1081782 RepID=A0ABM8NPC9_9BURK|nr:tail fiber domain-containing protein [Paraburkholderia hiiakae]CAD6536439.1 hypothetical protein LMG27952_03149 [Paraburkholderia hiiakae]
MTALQKVNLGTAPTGTDGDTVRTANVKANANVDVLTTQAILTSSSPNAVRDLTAADMGKRINFTPTSAASSHFPAANTTGADQIVSVHNLSTAYDVTMAIAVGSGDAAPTIVVVKPGELLTWETDGVSAWRTIGRKKAFDEVVQGKLSVAGALTASGSATVGGTLSVTGALTAGAPIKTSYAAATVVANDTSGNSQFGYGYQSNGSGIWATWVSPSRDWFLQRYVSGNPVDNPIVVANATGVASFSQRPVFAGNTPWDSGNLTPSQYAKQSSTTAFAAGDIASSGQLTSTGNAAIGTGASLVNIGPSNNSPISSHTPGLAWRSGSGIDLWGNTNPLNIGSGTTGIVSFYNGSSPSVVVGSITTTGAAVAYNTTSDYRLKENVASISGALARIRQVPARTFSFKADDTHAIVTGFIAHELQAVLPEAVHGDKDAVDDDGAPVFQVVDYSKCGPLMWAAISELAAALDAAVARVAELEAK